jgi:MerR family mercuric resistance operon transcriptional regulator
MTIGQLAKTARVGIETIRFYERQGLIQEPPRKESGFRQYPDEVVARLRFVHRAKELGFSLKEIKELLALRVDPDTNCADVKSRAEAKVADIEDKIETLQKMKLALVKLTRSCRSQGPISECPILAALDGESP